MKKILFVLLVLSLCFVGNSQAGIFKNPEMIGDVAIALAMGTSSIQVIVTCGGLPVEGKAVTLNRMYQTVVDGKTDFLPITTFERETITDENGAGNFVVLYGRFQITVGEKKIEVPAAGFLRDGVLEPYIVYVESCE